jgi:cytoskeleton protein RodZ
VFEIGNSLREARLRQHIELGEVEQQTKIRAKYLKALEDEQFQLLPAPTYVKGFLRNYADALGLEGQLYVDEYNSRFITGEEDVPLRPRDYQRRPQPLGHRFETRGIVLALGAIGVVFALVIAAWKFSSDNTPRYQGLNSKPVVVPRKKQKHRRTTARPLARLVVTATNGNSWLLVRAGSATGKTCYQGTLEQGQELPFDRPPCLYRRLWVAVAKPRNLVAKVNGRIRLIPGSVAAEQLIVTPTGIRKAPPPA